MGQITKITAAADDVIIEVTLGDGQPDLDGLVIPPDVMLQMARDWLTIRPNVKAGAGDPTVVGTGMTVWQDGDVTKAELMIHQPAARDRVTGGTVKDVSLGFISAQLEDDHTHDQAILKTGRLASVYLADPAEQDPFELFDKPWLNRLP